MVALAGVLLMRKSALLLLLAGLVLPALAAKDIPPQSNVLNRISVGQLEQVLAAAHDKPDEEDAEQLSGLELRERFGTVRFLHWQVRLSGPKSRQALTALADENRGAGLGRAAADDGSNCGLRNQDRPPVARFLRNASYHQLSG
jgi:hypothetical protein